MTAIKICGLTEPATLNTAVENGARFIGFVFYPPSPRNIAPDQARLLSQALPTSVRAVGLFVDPSDETLDHILGIVPLDMVQLHGSESPRRIKEIKARINMPIIKAVHIGSESDLAILPDIESVCDWVLFDTKTQDKTVPGGTGKRFDWTVLKDIKLQKPWMLSGGLDENNIHDAISLLNPPAIDISSGVESSKGIKNNEKIKSFINKVKSE